MLEKYQKAKRLARRRELYAEQTGKYDSGISTAEAVAGSEPDTAIEPEPEIEDERL